MGDENMLAIWERIRDELRRLRGRNLFRGQEIHLLPQRKVRLPVENRGDSLNNSEYVIHLSDTESEVYAERRPGNEILRLSDYDMDMAAFLEEVVGRCRGEDYLHTAPKEAKYRRKGESK